MVATAIELRGCHQKDSFRRQSVFGVSQDVTAPTNIWLLVPRGFPVSGRKGEYSPGSTGKSGSRQVITTR